MTPKHSTVSQGDRDASLLAQDPAGMLIFLIISPPFS